MQLIKWLICWKSLQAQSTRNGDVRAYISTVRALKNVFYLNFEPSLCVRTQMLSMLLRFSDSTINAQHSKTGMTALAMAAQAGYKESVGVLLRWVRVCFLFLSRAAHFEKITKLGGILVDFKCNCPILNYRNDFYQIFQCWLEEGERAL